jgi:hypothetical protein
MFSSVLFGWLMCYSIWLNVFRINAWKWVLLLVPQDDCITSCNAFKFGFVGTVKLWGFSLEDYLHLANCFFRVLSRKQLSKLVSLSLMSYRKRLRKGSIGWYFWERMKRELYKNWCIIWIWTRRTADLKGAWGRRGNKREGSVFFD